MRAYRTGNIVNGVTTFSDNIAIFGIILPKDQFMYNFALQNGGYPTNHPYSAEIAKRFGTELPFAINQKAQKDASPSEQGIIMPCDEDITQGALVGIKVLGDVDSKRLERKLGFELCRTAPLNVTDVTDILDLLNSLATNYQGFEHPDKKILLSDIGTVAEYFSGRYEGKVLDDIAKLSPRDAELIGLLRQCNFPESWTALHTDRFASYGRERKPLVL